MYASINRGEYRVYICRWYSCHCLWNRENTFLSCILFRWRWVVVWTCMNYFELSSGTCTTITSMSYKVECLADCRLLHTCKLTSRRPIMLIHTSIKLYKILGFYVYASINRDEYHVYISKWSSCHCLLHELFRIVYRYLYNNAITALPSGVFSGLLSLDILYVNLSSTNHALI